MTADHDARWMALALSLGRRGQGRVWPNPAVGCVLVKDGSVVGRGWTQPGGRPHAEVVALGQAGSAAQGAVAYVSLEPCSHIGQTGPCADALIKSGISRCVVACVDPDLRVSGQGISRLQSAGTDVVVGLLEDQARRDHAGFFKAKTVGYPRLTLKLAQSSDGRIATKTGDSKWITGTAARRAVHAERMRHDAVMVGGGTARADDPTLTVRGLGAKHQPVRIVVSSTLDFLGKALIETMERAPVWLCHGPEVSPKKIALWQGFGAELFEVQESKDGGLSCQNLLQILAARGLTSIYCEGGGTLAASLLKAGLVDDLLIYTAGVAIGSDGKPGLGTLGVSVLSDAPRYELVSASQIGFDLRSHWRVL